MITYHSEQTLVFILGAAAPEKCHHDNGKTGEDENVTGTQVEVVAQQRGNGLAHKKYYNKQTQQYGNDAAELTHEI